jgi:phosphoserine phosphatase
MIVSVFDCDGTLFSAHFGYGLLEYTRSRGLKGRIRRFYLQLMVPYLFRKLKIISAESLNRPVMVGLGSLIEDYDLQEGNAAFDWITNDFLLPTVHPEVISRLNEHKARGHRVILMTGIFNPCLELVGAHFGVTDLVGTEVEVVDGRYTGRILPPVVTGRDKLPALLNYCESQGLDIDWGSSHAYADSAYDHYVLEKVGHPVAVHPDEGLAALAKEKGWEVLAGE